MAARKRVDAAHGETAAPKSRKIPGTTRLSVVLKNVVDTGLYAKAKKRGCSKSEMAALLIERGLKKSPSDRVLRQALEEADAQTESDE
jgi:hypothetical protein